MLRRFRELVRVHKRSPDNAGGVHVGKDDLDVRAGEHWILFGYAGDETGKTKAGDAGCETAILYELMLGDVVTTFRTSGFGVETVEYKKLSFTEWGFGGQGKVRSLWRYFYQGKNGLMYLVNSNFRNKVVDAT